MQIIHAPFLRAALAATVLAGCTLDPSYTRPDLPVAAAYPDTGGRMASGGTEAPAALIGWRDFFLDPQLKALIEIALRNNRDLRVAALNVVAAQAQYRSQFANLFPQIDASGSGQYSSLPTSTTIPSSTGASLSGGASTGSPSSLIQTGSQHTAYRYFTASLGFTSYELDLFGKVRSQTRQAFELALGYEDTRVSTLISLVSEVASGYLTVLADRELLRITQETLDSTSRSLALTQAQLRGGTTTLVSVRQAETTVDQARANLSLYTRQLAQDTNALVLLLGQPLPPDLPAGRTLDTQELLADIPAGLPSELLVRRPDVRAAEHNLLAANANIGAARAAFFPSITLTASDGVASNRLRTLFTGGATTWSFAPQINIPIFTAGQNQANLDYAKVQKSIQVADYEKTVQTAFREVSDALAGRSTYADQIQAQQALVDASADNLRLSQMRFQAGVDTFLSVLDAQRTLYSAQQTLVTLKQSQAANLITLYKTLGGGWSPDSLKQVASR